MINVSGCDTVLVVNPFISFFKEILARDDLATALNGLRARSSARLFLSF